jgi:hypothetical protein
MQVPAAMFIESAADTLKSDWGAREWVKADQSKEFLCAMGAATCEKLGLHFPPTSGEQTAYNLWIAMAH